VLDACALRPCSPVARPDRRFVGSARAAADQEDPGEPLPANEAATDAEHGRPTVGPVVAEDLIDLDWYSLHSSDVYGPLLVLFVIVVVTWIATR
jgi:hypothetical protein